MNDEQRAPMFYLSLGLVAGNLMDKAFFLSLLQPIKAGSVNPEYVRLVRDRLAIALDEANRDPTP